MTPIPEFATAALVEPFKRLFFKYGFILWIATVAALMLGFKTLSPNERLAAVESRVAAMQEQAQADQEVRASMIRWMCVKSTPKEIALAGLKCE